MADLTVGERLAQLETKIEELNKNLDMHYTKLDKIEQSLMNLAHNGTENDIQIQLLSRAMEKNESAHKDMYNQLNKINQLIDKLETIISTRNADQLQNERRLNNKLVAKISVIAIALSTATAFIVELLRIKF